MRITISALIIFSLFMQIYSMEIPYEVDKTIIHQMPERIISFNAVGGDITSCFLNEFWAMNIGLNSLSILANKASITQDNVNQPFKVACLIKCSKDAQEKVDVNIYSIFLDKLFLSFCLKNDTKFMFPFTEKQAIGYKLLQQLGLDEERQAHIIYTLHELSKTPLEDSSTSNIKTSTRKHNKKRCTIS